MDTSTPSAPVANEKRRRTPFEFNLRTAYYRTTFPGHRPRYLPVSGIQNTKELFQKCADLWPEYFGVSSPHPFSWTDNRTPGAAHVEADIKIKGLLGIAYQDDRDGMLAVSLHEPGFVALECGARNDARKHAEEMEKKYRISVSGNKVTYKDIVLVREGRDEVKVEGNGSFYRRRRVPLEPRVIGGEERRKAIRKRTRNMESEEGVVEERPTQRRRT